MVDPCSVGVSSSLLPISGSASSSPSHQYSSSSGVMVAYPIASSAPPATLVPTFASASSVTSNSECDASPPSPLLESVSSTSVVLVSKQADGDDSSVVVELSPPYNSPRSVQSTPNLSSSHSVVSSSPAVPSLFIPSALRIKSNSSVSTSPPPPFGSDPSPSCNSSTISNVSASLTSLIGCPSSSTVSLMSGSSVSSASSLASVSAFKRVLIVAGGSSTPSAAALSSSPVPSSSSSSNTTSSVTNAHSMLLQAQQQVQFQQQQQQLALLGSSGVTSLLPSSTNLVSLSNLGTGSPLSISLLQLQQQQQQQQQLAAHQQTLHPLVTSLSQPYPAHIAHGATGPYNAAPSVLLAAGGGGGVVSPASTASYIPYPIDIAGTVGGLVSGGLPSQSVSIGSLYKRRRRTALDLNDYEKWNCPKKCGRVYRKNSTVSIRKHQQECSFDASALPPGSAPFPRESLSDDEDDAKATSVAAPTVGGGAASGLFLPNAWSMHTADIMSGLSSLPSNLFLPPTLQHQPSLLSTGLQLPSLSPLEQQIALQRAVVQQQQQQQLHQSLMQVNPDLLAQLSAVQQQQNNNAPGSDLTASLLLAQLQQQQQQQMLSPPIKRTMFPSSSASQPTPSSLEALIAQQQQQQQTRMAGVFNFSPSLGQTFPSGAASFPR